MTILLILMVYMPSYTIYNEKNILQRGRNKMSKTKQFFTGLLNNVLFGIKTSFAASKFYFSLKLIILLSSTAVPLINIWLWKEVLNGIVEYEKAGKTVIIRALKKSDL